jgi:hypothetical protein
MPKSPYHFFKNNFSILYVEGYNYYALLYDAFEFELL